MVDYDAMMSSTGGTGFGDRALGSGLLAGVGITAIELFVRNEKQLKKELKQAGTKFASALKSDRKLYRAGSGLTSIGRAPTGGVGPRVTAFTRLDQIYARHQLRSGSSGSTINRRISLNDNLLASTRANILKHTNLRNTEIGALKSTVSGIRNSFANSKRTLKTLGWVSTITDAFFIAESMFNPGPSMSAKAQASDMQAFNSLQGSGAMTQRQRSLQAIHDSQLSINPILGNEAMYMHK